MEHIHQQKSYGSSSWITSRTSKDFSRTLNVKCNIAGEGKDSSSDRVYAGQYVYEKDMNMTYKIVSIKGTVEPVGK